MLFLDSSTGNEKGCAVCLGRNTVHIPHGPSRDIPVDAIPDHESTLDSKNEDTTIEREIRFAVVIYGGVLLTIYINGIVQEMLHLVRSTANDLGFGR